MDELFDRDPRAERRDVDTAREVRGGGGEDVPPMEGPGDRLQSIGGLGELDRLLDAAKPLRRDQQKPVVRPDVGAAVAPAESEGLAIAPDAGVDHGQVHSLGHVRKRAREYEGALEHVGRRDPVRDVDHLSFGRDALDDAVTRADEVVLEAEVGQEGDEPRDAASLTAATSPSRSCVVASTTTSRPRPAASSEVTGPIDTHGRSRPSAAKPLAAEADARTTRSASGNLVGRSSRVR